MTKNYSLLRINKDILEITKYPIEGIGIVSLNNNPKEYIVNTRIMSGIYEGYCLQMLLTFPDNYPIFPPKILIYPGQPFDNSYHHHIYEDNNIDENGGHFKKFCFDLLQNDFLSTTQQFSGWNASYTISTLLLQVQNFLSIPDMPENHLPDKNKIDELMKSMGNYERMFVINNENGETIKLHTWKNPYPEMYFKNIENEKNKIKKDEVDNFEDNKIKMIKDNLTCFISRLNYIDNQNILFGYPIKKNIFEKYIPIPVILSYESYMIQLSNKDDIFSNQSQIFHRLRFGILNNDYYNLHSFKSANNEYYENWLPIYINENHYLKNKTAILNSFSIIKYGNLGLKEYDFKPEHIFEILPNLLYEMIIKMINKKSEISSSFVICFFQYMLLFQKLFQKFRKAYRKYINDYLDKQLNNFYNDNYPSNAFDELNINKKILKLLILLHFSNEDPNSKEMQKLEKYLNKNKNKLYLDLFNSIEEFTMNKSELFIDDLFKYDIFYKIVDLISFNKEYLKKHNWQISKNSRKKIIKKMMNNFKEIYGECNYELYKKIDQLLIENLNINEYFDIKEYLLYHIDNEQVSENYNLFLIFYILKGKMRQKNFIKKLEENYGVFLNADNYIKEINEIINISNNFLKNMLNYNKYFGKVFIKNLNDLIFLKNKKIKSKMKSYEKKEESIYASLSKLIIKKFGFDNKFIIQDNLQQETEYKKSKKIRKFTLRCRIPFYSFKIEIKINIKKDNINNS